jgi:ATP-binding cassette subfamily B protein
MNADNIVVLDHGKITEQGTHEKLVARRGAYYNLVKDQLSLGE